MTRTPPTVTALLELQDGVVSRRQLLAEGLSPADVVAAVRRRTLFPMFPGVYIHHNGPPTWQQRAWGAVLSCWPAVLANQSARRAHEGPGRRDSDDGPIHVAVVHSRHPAPRPGVVVHRMRRFDEQVQWNLCPPRMRYDDAIIAIADATRDDLSAIAVIADACGGRRTTAERLLSSMGGALRLDRRAWLTGVLTDLAEGACSVLEHGYLTRVERAHGLPQGLRQVPATGSDGRSMFRDVVYGGRRPRWRQIVEIDGRLFHSSLDARDRDMDRDLDAAVDLEDTVRIGYGQVFARSCRTAARLAALLTARGWTGRAHPCPECPPGLGWPPAAESG